MLKLPQLQQTEMEHVRGLAQVAPTQSQMWHVAFLLPCSHGKIALAIRSRLSLLQRVALKLGHHPLNPEEDLALALMGYIGSTIH